MILKVGLKKQISDFQTMVGMFSSIYKQYILNDHKFFAIQNFGLYRSVDKDSLWSFCFFWTITFRKRDYLKIRFMWVKKSRL